MLYRLTVLCQLVNRKNNLAGFGPQYLNFFGKICDARLIACLVLVNSRIVAACIR